MSDKIGDPQFDHAPPNVVWHCPKRHTLLRVYLIRNGWHVLGESFGEPLKERLKRDDSEWTVDDFKQQRVAAFELHRIQGVDELLDVDIDMWPAVGFEIGCHCKATWVSLNTLAADCRRARDERRTIRRMIR